MVTCHTTTELIKNLLVSNARAKIICISIDKSEVSDDYVIFLRSEHTKRSIASIRLTFRDDHKIKANFAVGDTIASVVNCSDSFYYKYTELDKVFEHINKWFNVANESKKMFDVRNDGK